MTDYQYERDGAAIYARSFATIRAEADLSGLPVDAHALAVRVIHASGMVGVAQALRIAPGFAAVARAALRDGCSVFCDSEMVAHGVTRARLPAGNAVICTLRDPRTPDLAQSLGTTRSAAAIDLWGPAVAGAVVAIGNAPTALFHLLERIQQGGPRPAAIIGMPVGFVGAAESKEALAHWGEIPWAIIAGRQGGSAMAAAAVNALASERE